MSLEAENALPTADLPPLRMTDNAISKVKAFATSKPQEAEGKHFRVFIQGGGCSGYSYGFKFDQKRDGDLELSAKDITILIDPASLEQIKGCTIDYVEDFGGSGFAVNNPNATSTCGCGVSFSTTQVTHQS